MIIKPFNRYILVKPIEEKKKDNNLSIVLPTDYKKPENPHVRCVVKDISTKSIYYNELQVGDTIIVERRMLDKIEFDQKEAYLVLENYIYGRITNEINETTS